MGSHDPNEGFEFADLLLWLAFVIYLVCTWGTYALWRGHSDYQILFSSTVHRHMWMVCDALNSPHEDIQAFAAGATM